MESLTTAFYIRYVLLRICPITFRDGKYHRSLGRKTPIDDIWKRHGSRDCKSRYRILLRFRTYCGKRPIVMPTVT
jgi:hypothetical protein